MVQSALDPTRYRLLVQEDGPVEWLGVWSFALAAVLLAIQAQRTTTAGWRERAVLVALAAFCLFAAGEEISWGERLLSFQPPEVFLRSNTQQESNLHNLIEPLLASRWQIFGLACVYGLLAPVAARLRWIPRYLAPEPQLIPAMAGVALLELSYPTTLTGEVAEALLALSFAHDAMMRWAGEPVRAARLQLATVAGCVALGWATPPLLDATVFRPDPARLERAAAELAELGGHLERGGAEARLFGRRRVHKRVYTAVEAGYLAHPHSRGDSRVVGEEELRAHYLLDPWQQPYWLLFEVRTRSIGVALLYSFGPNRRRDTAVGQAPESEVMAGDDLAVRVVVHR